MTMWWRRAWLATRQFDWILIAALAPLVLAGLATMNSFTADNYFFNRQLIWLAISLILFFALALTDWYVLRRSGVVLTIYLVGVGLLGLVVVIGRVVRGAQSWFSLGGISLQPADLVKLCVILILAKYFSRRHVEIANLRHILVSAVYALVPAALIFLQHDFGSALIIMAIWFGMILVSGVSKKHLLAVILVGLALFAGLWWFAFSANQQARIISFISPLADLRGTGYNAFQSTVAIGSGQWLGKGVGYGTQSRLKFLPEYETDFIFAAFAEEWGLVGVLLLFIFFGLVIWRVIVAALHGRTNFETLFGLGVAIFLMSHLVINIGMNSGLLPVTGLPLPFVSYGGSHLLVEFASLGILLGMRRYSPSFHQDDVSHNEFLGGV